MAVIHIVECLIRKETVEIDGNGLCQYEETCNIYDCEYNTPGPKKKKVPLIIFN